MTKTLWSFGCSGGKRVKNLRFVNVFVVCYNIYVVSFYFACLMLTVEF